MTATAGDALSHAARRDRFRRVRRDEFAGVTTGRGTVFSGSKQGQLFRALMHRSHVLSERTAPQGKPFHCRVTCQDTGVAGDDFIHQYFQVTRWLTIG